MNKLLINILRYYLVRLKRMGLKHGLRYEQLYQIIENKKPKNIMEIGVYNGENAIRMLTINRELQQNYYGFDLFENLDKLHFEKEIVILPLTLKQIKAKLTKRTNANINLYKGNTLDLNEDFFKDFPKMDLIFIDGGHSIETQRNDWNIVQNLIKENTIIIIDDCWNLPNSGCKFLIDEIDRNKFIIGVLPKVDYYIKEWGILKTQFLKITRK